MTLTSLASFFHFKDPCVYTGTTWIIQHNLPHLKILDLTTSAKYLLLGEVTYSKILVIRMWAFVGVCHNSIYIKFKIGKTNLIRIIFGLGETCCFHTCSPPIHAPKLPVIFHNWKWNAFYWVSLSIGNKIKSPVLSHGTNSSSFLFYPLHSSYAGLPSVSDVCPAFSVLVSLTLLISFIAHLFIPARMHATEGQKLTVFWS